MNKTITQEKLKVAFIDRDGVLIHEPQDTYQIDTLEKLKILPGAIDGLQRIQKDGYKLVMISNQDGLGTDSFSTTAFEEVQSALLASLKKRGVLFYRIFICPHFPQDKCLCRKPQTGLLNEFLETEPIDHEKSFVVGDRESDVELAKNIGVHAYRMETNGQFPYTTSAHYLKSLTNKVDWNKVNGFVPTIIQDVSSGIVLMLGYMDKAALTKTEDTGFVWFFSRTKKRLWKKGEVSGNVLRVQSMELDCDNDTLLVSVIPAGPTCHTGDVSCFKELRSHNEIATLFSTITERKRDLPRGSYTTSLFNAGLDRIALKVAEESMEIIHAATKQTEQRLIEETVDLFYHLFVLLAAKSIDFSSIEAEMRKRYKVTYTNHP